MMSTESVKPKTEPRTCDVCAQEEDSHAEFSWQLAREDVEVAGDDDILVLLESRLAGPTVIVLPEAGGVVVYSVIRCCDGCLNESFRRYEDSHNPRPKKTRRALLDDIKGVSQEKGWLLYALQLDHLAPRGFPNVALIRDEQLRLNLRPAGGLGAAAPCCHSLWSGLHKPRRSPGHTSRHPHCTG